MRSTQLAENLSRVVLFLEHATEKISDYLNNVTITALQSELAGNRSYYLELLKALRKLTVFCDEALEACYALLRNKSFNDKTAEQLLEKVYQQCIERFFQPKNDVWYENSRSAYTDTYTIKFRQTPPPSLAAIVNSLEDDFLEIREKLDRGVHPQF